MGQNKRSIPKKKFEGLKVRPRYPGMVKTLTDKCVDITDDLM